MDHAQWWQEQAKLDSSRPQGEFAGEAQTMKTMHEDRDDEIWRLHQLGYGHKEIGKMVKPALSKPCVGYHIRKMIREGRA